MPRINAQRLKEVLEGLLTMTTVCWEMSKNQELTEQLEQLKMRIEAMINTLDATFHIE